MADGTNPRAAEFFAGIGLVRRALARAEIDVVWANDIAESKFSIYEENFGGQDFLLADIRNVTGDDIPDCEIATASFPCTDLSLAGNRLGLAGEESGMLWEFARILDEMGPRRPATVMVENVPGFATSHGGADLRAAIETLNRLGYCCDILVLDAKHFVPQSRVRLFIVGQSVPPTVSMIPGCSEVRPAWLLDFARTNPHLDVAFAALGPLPEPGGTVADVVERLASNDPRWWGDDRVDAFVDSLSEINAERLDSMLASSSPSWRTAFRRTRGGVAVWEIRADLISGCLRTARGGSSKQALVEAGCGILKVRWMTSLEYARLQGAPRHRHSTVSDAKALFGYGDAVCVPAVAWIAEQLLSQVATALSAEPSLRS